MRVCISVPVIWLQTLLVGQKCQLSATDVTAVYICSCCPALQDRDRQLRDAEKDSAWIQRENRQRMDSSKSSNNDEICYSVGLWFWLLNRFVSDTAAGCVCWCLMMIAHRADSEQGGIPLSDLNLSLWVWRHHIRTIWLVGKFGYIYLENCKDDS